MAQLKYFRTIFLPLEDREVFKMSLCGDSSIVMLRVPVLEYRIQAVEEWRKWRTFVANTLYASSASMISGFFGHNYVSYKQTLLDHMQEKELTGEWQMADAAKKHGTDNEPTAKRAFVNIMQPQSKQKKVSVLEDGECTKLTMFYDLPTQQNAFIMTTPDMLLRIGNEKAIVEIKCPYFELFQASLRNNRSVTKIASDYLHKHPNGRENSFLQALTYAYTEEVSRFYVCYYFTDTIDEAMVVYEYHRGFLPDDRFTGEIMRAMLNIKEQLAKEPSEIKVRTATTDKRMVTKKMEFYFINAHLYEYKEDGKWHCLTAESDEETSYYSEDDGPHVPREPRG